MERLNRLYPLLDECSSRPFQPQGNALSQRCNALELHNPGSCPSSPQPPACHLPFPQSSFPASETSVSPPRYDSSPSRRVDSFSSSLGSFSTSGTPISTVSVPAKLSRALSTQPRTPTGCGHRHYRLFFIQPLTYYYGMMDRWFSQMASALIRESQRTCDNETRKVHCTLPRSRDKEKAEHDSGSGREEGDEERKEGAQSKGRQGADGREARGNVETRRETITSSAGPPQERTTSDPKSTEAARFSRGGHHNRSQGTAGERTRKPPSDQRSLREGEGPEDGHRASVRKEREGQGWHEEPTPTEGVFFDVFVWGEGFAGFPALRPSLACPSNASRPLMLLFTRAFPSCKTSSPPLSFGRAVSRWFGGQTANDVFLLHWTHLPRFADSRGLYSGYDGSFWRKDVLPSSVFVLIEHEWVDDAQRRLLAVRPNLVLHTYNQILAFGPASKTFLGDASESTTQVSTGEGESALGSQLRRKLGEDGGSRHQYESVGADEDLIQERTTGQLGLHANANAKWAPETRVNLGDEERQEEAKRDQARQTGEGESSDRYRSVYLPSVYERGSWVSFLHNTVEWLFNSYRPPPTLILKDSRDENSTAQKTTKREKAGRTEFWTSSAIWAAAVSAKTRTGHPTGLEPSGRVDGGLLESLMPHGIDSHCFLSNLLSGETSLRALQPTQPDQVKPQAQRDIETSTGTVGEFWPSPRYLTLTREKAGKNKTDKRRRDVFIATERPHANANPDVKELTYHTAWRGSPVPREGETKHKGSSPKRKEQEDQLKWIEEEIERVIRSPRRNDLLLVGNLSCNVYPTRHIFSAALDSIRAEEEQGRRGKVETTNNTREGKRAAKERETVGYEDNRNLQGMGDGNGDTKDKNGNSRSWPGGGYPVVLRAVMRLPQRVKAEVRSPEGDQPDEWGEAASPVPMMEADSREDFGTRFPRLRKATPQRRLFGGGTSPSGLRWGGSGPLRPSGSAVGRKNSLRETGWLKDRKQERQLSIKTLPPAKYIEDVLQPEFRQELEENLSAIFDKVAKREEISEYRKRNGGAENEDLGGRSEKSGVRPTRDTLQEETKHSLGRARKHEGLSEGHLQGFCSQWRQHHNSYLASMRETKICLYGGHKGWTLRKGIEMLASGCVVVEMKLGKKGRTKNRNTDHQERRDGEHPSAKEPKKSADGSLGMMDFQDFVVNIPIDLSVVAAQDHQSRRKNSRSHEHWKNARKQAPNDKAGQAGDKAGQAGDKTGTRNKGESARGIDFTLGGGSVAAPAPGLARRLSDVATPSASLDGETSDTEQTTRRSPEEGDSNDSEEDDEDQEEFFILEPEEHWDAYVSLCDLDKEAQERLAAEVARQLRRVVRRFDEGQFDTLRREGMRFALLERDYVHLSKTFLFPLIEVMLHALPRQMSPREIPAQET
ncbi:hypothetical protein CSUI_000738 [Cystoisospora suis]|uniref:Uncharacterized protein n=1 Tax=Cystoisospora suis TaxID=483139 RepID=A0A2C6LEY6_9APIC|nr:hypothetical protein CSUI_000738 [Cystoisospora suis]